MTLTVEAVYENGVLKLEKPLPLAEHERVGVSVDSNRRPHVNRPGCFAGAATGDAPPPRG